MKARPILYSTPMVQAINLDTKTQTRRTKNLDEVNKRANDWLNPVFSEDDKMWVFTAEHGEAQHLRIKCPYGVIGDLLYVKETCSFFMQGNGRIQREKTKYKADEKWGNNPLIKWTPSIHMPKAAARIWLQINNIRIERLKDITEHDAIAEGVETINVYDADKKKYDIRFRDYSYSDMHHPKARYFQNPIASFRTLWRAINGKQSSDANPWVWVIEFKVVSKTGFGAIPESIRKELAA